jgi:hypothetical protein
MKLTTLQFKNNKKHGVYVFHAPGCFTCETHIKSMDEHIGNYNLIEVDDVDYCESIGITLTPCTLVFKNDKEIFRKQGAFFITQIEELRKSIGEL